MDIQNHSALIASKIVGKFKEDIPVRSGYSCFFPRETTPTLDVDIQVERDDDLIATDVVRFTAGNKSKYSKLTEKKFRPPFFKQEYYFAQDDVYLNTVAQGIMNSSNANNAIAQKGLDAMRRERKKIERAIRKQQGEVLQTGIITLKNGDNIDFKRKAESIVDLTNSNYWDGNSNPLADIQKGCKFLREVGNSYGSTVNMFLRDAGLNALLNNENKALNNALDTRRMNRANIVMPQFNDASGMTFHGQFAAGDFTINIWTYNEKGTNAETKVTEYYQEEHNAILLPSDFQGKTIMGGLPYLRKVGKMKVPAVIASEYLIRGWDDEATISSTLELTSAPLVVPFTIDKIYTMKVLG